MAPVCASVDSPGMSREKTRTPEDIMSKGDKQRGNRETKKPKQDKKAVSATANSQADKGPLTLGAKKPTKG